MHALSLHIDGKALKVALLYRKKQAFRIDLLRTYSLEEEPPVKPLYILAPILAGKKVRTATALKATEMLIRELEIKLEKKSAIKNTLPFQIEPLLPFPLEGSIVLPFFTSHQDGTTAVTLFATTEAQLKKHLEEMAALEVDPDVVSCIPSALTNIQPFASSQQGVLYLGHFEDKHSVFCCYVDKKLIASTSLPVGKSHFLEALQRDLPEKTIEECEELAKKLDLESIEKEEFPHLHQCKEQLRKDLFRLLSFLEGKAKATGGEFVLSGDLPSLFHFKSTFQSCLSAEITLGSLAGIQNFPPAEIESFAIPIGLALEALSTKPTNVQFRQGQFLPNRVIQKRKKQLTTYLASCLALAVLTFATSLFFVKKKESSLLERLYSYRQYGEEKKAERKGSSLSSELESWEREIAKKKKPFAYYSSMPRVSDLMAWLSTHPFLTPKNGPDGDKIEITSVKYSLQKYPKIGESSEPYVAKVDLEFSASSPAAAESFHESLQRGEGLANEKKEITWKAQQNNYRASFFLKPLKRDAQ